MPELLETAHDLVAMALMPEATDFTGDLSGVGSDMEMHALASEAIGIVAEDAPPCVAMAAVVLLAAKGWEILEEDALDEAAALKDAVEAGDRDRNGWILPWEPYHGG
jgi:hypothetical protein